MDGCELVSLDSWLGSWLNGWEERSGYGWLDYWLAGCKDGEGKIPYMVVRRSDYMVGWILDYRTAS